MPKIEVDEYVFPLVGIDYLSSKAKGKQIYGTAFYLNNNNFITAGHSIKNILKHKMKTLGYPNGNHYFYTDILEHEIVNDFDLGFFKAALPIAKAFQWNLSELNLLDKVRTAGFAHALDYEHNEIHLRSYEGYIVSSGIFHRLPPKVFCYELSFACPEGLSGAPLVTSTEDLTVNGMILGNESTEMLVYTDKEVIKEKSKESIVERYKAVQYGVAIQVRSLQDIESRILGGSLAEYLKSTNLI